MSSPDSNTFNSLDRFSVVQVPHRPSTDDFDGCACENAVAAPDAQTQPTAPAWNSMGRTIEGLGAVVPVLIVSVRGATTTLQSFTSANRVLVQGDLTLSKNGTGDFSITWAAGKFPPPVVDPVAWITDLTLDGFVRAYAITNGVRVVTKDTAGAAADMRFTVALF